MPDAPASALFPSEIDRAAIDSRHPEYRGAYLERLQAMVEGGCALLQNETIVDEVFPRHGQELFLVYQERRKRAVYENHAGEIIGYLVSNFAQSPVTVSLKSKQKSAEPEPLDSWYQSFLEDMSSPGGDRLPLSTYLRNQVEAMLVKRTAWARVDLPEVNPDETPPANLREQEGSGQLDAYVVEIPAESVTDWDEDDDGELLWLTTYSCTKPRKSWKVARNQIVETWQLWTREGWAIYQAQRSENDKADLKEKVKKLSEGRHTMGVVPFVRSKLKHGLWAMNVLESLARDHLNTRSGLSWATLQSLHQELYEFQGKKEKAGPRIGKDEDRSTNQPRGQGYVQIRAENDKVMYVGPDPASFDVASKICKDLSDAMHRVTHLMAMSVEQSASMLGRSAASKSADMASTVVVLGALGEYVREHAVAIMKMVSRARGDKPEMYERWQATGASNFESTTADGTISRAMDLTSIPIQSETFQQMFQEDVAQAWLGERGTPVVMEAIRNELLVNVTSETLQTMGTRNPVQLMPKAAAEDEESEETEEEPPAKAKAKAKAKPKAKGKGKKQESE
jgi:hypothetical protein